MSRFFTLLEGECCQLRRFEVLARGLQYIRAHLNKKGAEMLFTTIITLIALVGALTIMDQLSQRNDRSVEGLEQLLNELSRKEGWV